MNTEHLLCAKYSSGSHRDTREGYDTDLDLEELLILLGKKT